VTDQEHGEDQRQATEAEGQGGGAWFEELGEPRLTSGAQRHRLRAATQCGL
jgi:hypothetical protein